uniref:B30.2/SPRY domain-containing protein n=1 Tax=Amphimedon queenslandica TaxID=400682 RepID=A0A1X7SWT2_AMPQE
MMVHLHVHDVFLLALLSVSVKGQVAVWTQIPGPNNSSMHSVSANSQFLWGINSKNEAMYCLRPCKGNWIYSTPNMRSLDAGPVYTWFIGLDNNTYHATVKKSSIAMNITEATEIAAGGNGFIWYLDQYGYTWKWSIGLEYADSSNDRKFINIAANSEHVFGIDGEGTINYCAIVGGPWKTIPGHFISMTAGSQEIFAIDRNNRQLYRCTIPCAENWEAMESPSNDVVQLDATIDALFAVSSKGAIYRHHLSLM